MKTDTEKLTYTIPELCQMAGIGRNTLHKAWKEGWGPASIKIGRRRIIRKESGDKWLADLEAGIIVPGKSH